MGALSQWCLGVDREEKDLGNRNGFKEEIISYPMATFYSSKGLNSCVEK